ncbi:MAG: flavodoxin [Archangium sp.]|nr:flavodoxin [Archangium sp.]
MSLVQKILLIVAIVVVGLVVLVGVALTRWGGGKAHVGRAVRLPGAKVLVVYYSRSGTTAKVADAIAAGLGADVEPIVDTADRDGVAGFVRSLRDTMGKRPATIKPLTVDPSKYELVIVGTPVWGNAASTPVRAFFAQYRALPKVAFFITDGLSSHEVVFRDLESLAGQAPVATLGLAQGEVLAGQDAGRVTGFVASLRR